MFRRNQNVLLQWQEPGLQRKYLNDHLFWQRERVRNLLLRIGWEGLIGTLFLAALLILPLLPDSLRWVPAIIGISAFVAFIAAVLKALISLVRFRRHRVRLQEDRIARWEWGGVHSWDYEDLASYSYTQLTYGDEQVQALCLNETDGTITCLELAPDLNLRDVDGIMQTKLPYEPVMDDVFALDDQEPVDQGEPE